jgi:hypothetical protein
MSSRLLAPVRSWETRRALRQARRRADEELLASRLASPRLAWRTAELIAAANRHDLGRSLIDIVHASDERLLPTAAPINRGAVRECRAELLELAARLYDTQPVTARGVLLVERLVHDGSGPLYGSTDAQRLARGIGVARRAIDGAGD